MVKIADFKIKMMLLQVIIVVAAVLAFIAILRKMVKKELKNKLMRCPNCHSHKIYPETDALWNCIDCDSIFSLNNII